MKTTLTIDDDIAARLAKAQRKTGLTFKEIVNQTLRQGVERRPASLRKIPRVVVKARPMGRIPGLNYANIGELLEHLEGSTHQ
ncbi:MAG: hypothetical protein SF339_24740 [Blastocatellia bacterium]|nr:hypothetical protein [Blastocatellia bacterium]